MAAAKLNLYIEQGATFSKTLTFKDGAGVPIDITGWVFSGQVRRAYSSSDILETFTFVTSNQITNTGEVVVSLTSAETMAIPADYKVSTYAYDIETTVGATVTRVVEGSVSFSAEVTK
jgi:hypothetical protein